MNQLSNGSSKESDSERMSSSPPSDTRSFVGIEKLKEYFYQQLEHFKEWDANRDWLAFHHHHYDWWMFPSESSIVLHR